MIFFYIPSRPFCRFIVIMGTKYGLNCPTGTGVQSYFSGSNTSGTMKICSRQRKFEPMRVNHSIRSGGIFGIFFSILFNMKVCCVLYKSPHRGDSNECTQYTFSNIKQKIILNYPKSAAVGFFIRDSRTSLKQP